MEKNRCAWCPPNSPEYMAYHDTEWGIPVHDERQLFEMLCLESMQAGLSWITILKRRERYRQAFDNFDYDKIVHYTDEKVAQLLLNRGIIRNKLKVRAIIKNARVYRSIREELGSFDSYLWSFVGGEPLINYVSSFEDIPTQTPLSQEISKDLKKRGMTFVGPVIIYAYLQAVGVVNDHETGCFCFKG